MTWNPLAVPGSWSTIGQRLREVARARGSAVAVTGPDGEFDYATFIDLVDRYAAVAPTDKPVLAIWMDGTADCVARMFGVILAGRLALPLDPMLPADRIEQILGLSGAERFDQPPAPEPASPVDASIAGEDPAVVIYTSGSTGAPKGCVHNHETWLNQAYVGVMTHDQRPGSRNAMVLPLCYGGGLDVVFFSLLTGASLHVRDPRLVGMTDFESWLRAERITALHTTPSLLKAILDRVDALPESVRIVTSGGEPVPWSLVDRVRQAAEGPVDFVVFAGASEAGSLFSYRVRADEAAPREGQMPAGYPVPNRDVFIVAEDERPLPNGAVGLLRVRSRYLASGYLGDPDRTAQTWRPLPDGRREFRASDLARMDDDGRVHLLGRADSAVKVRGYLVAPSEIESALLVTDGVAEAVVTAGGDELNAYVAAERRDQPVTPAGIRRSLIRHLPTWMVPSRIVVMDRLPRNERGKVDRRALPPSEPAPIVAPRTPTERVLADLWSEVLSIDELSVHDDFWQLGADSLATEEMLAAVQSATGIPVRSSTIVEAPTVAELAAVIDGHRPDSEGLPRTAVRLRRGANGDSSASDPVLHLFAGGGAPALSMLPLVAAMETDLPAYGYQASGYESRGMPDFRLESVVSRHLQVISGASAHRPTVLIGHSFGGFLALAAARRLVDAGHPVPLVVLLDPILSQRVIDRAGLDAGHPSDRPVMRPDGPGPAAPTPPFAERMRIHLRQLGQGWRRWSPTMRNDVFWEASLRMVNRHVLRPWSGRTLLFTAPDNPNDLSWWDEILTGPHEHIAVDGGHTSILRPPFNAVIAERLDRELRTLSPSTAPRQELS